MSGGEVEEKLWVDPVCIESRPRIVTSVDGVKAMHMSISVLTRKADNLSLAKSRVRLLLIVPKPKDNKFLPAFKCG